MQPDSIRGPDVVRFLKHLLRHLSGPLLVLRDGSPIRRAQAVKGFLAAGDPPSGPHEANDGLDDLFDRGAGVHLQGGDSSQQRLDGSRVVQDHSEFLGMFPV